MVDFSPLVQTHLKVVKLCDSIVSHFRLRLWLPGYYGRQISHTDQDIFIQVSNSKMLSIISSFSYISRVVLGLIIWEKEISAAKCSS